MVEGERTEQGGVGEGEHRRVRPDAQREGEDRRDRESRALRERTKREREVFEEVLHNFFR